MVVAHNGAKYLPQTLKALTGQTRPPDFYIGVDAGSHDTSVSILQLELPVGSPVAGASPRAGFGTAVKVGLTELPAHGPANEGRTAQDWIWLLHDDSAPEPDALKELLLAVERAPSVTIAGTKQVEWDDRRKLVDVGLSISRWAERLTLIDADELDQGQYDGRSDVFAVNSAGMLIRRDAWDSLGGFDPALPGTGDDIDLCWRNRLAGNRVVVVPQAVLRHAGSRSSSATSPMAARRAEVYLRLKHAALWKVPFLAVGALLGGVGRFLLGILGKAPGHGFGQLAGTIAGVLAPLDLLRSRRSAARTRKVSRNLVRGLTTGRREVRSHRRSLLEALTSGSVVGDGTGSDGQGTDVPTGDAVDDFAALAAPPRAWVGAGAVSAALVLLAVSLLAMFRLIGAAALSGGALLPVSESLGRIWRNAGSWWISLGSGLPGHGDPFDYVLWVLAAAAGGNGSTAVVVLIFLLLPLAGLSAWTAAGAFTQRRGLRFWAAMFWAGVPALQVAIGSGRLGAMVVHVVLPLVALGMVRAVGAARSRASIATYRASSAEVVLKPGIHGVPSWTAAAATGLALAVVTASAPSLLPLAILAVAGIMLLAGRRARTLWWSLLPSVALFVPLILSTPDRLRAVIADPGLPLPFTAAELWQQVLGYPVAFAPASGLTAAGLFAGDGWSAAVALIIGAPVVVLAVVALFARGPGRQGAPTVLWILAALTLLAAFLSGQVATAVGSSSLVTPFTGPFVSVFVLLMLLAALLGADRMLGSMPPRENQAGSGLRWAAIAAAVVLAIGPTVSLAAWTLPQVTGSAPDAAAGTTLLGTGMSLEATEPLTLPATATDIANSPRQTRTLVLSLDGEGQYTAALMSDGGTTLDQLSAVYSAHRITGPPGAAVVTEPDGAETALRRSVAAITGGSGVDPRQELQELGVGFVVLRESGSAAELVAANIDAVPGLGAVGRTDAGWLWRVAGPLEADGTEDITGESAWARIVDAAGTTLALVDSRQARVDSAIAQGPDVRRIVLAERSDPGWTATLDGKPLQATTADWAQAFELPTDGGRLNIRYVTPWEPWIEVGQGIIIGLTVLLAIPMPARRRYSTRPPRKPGAHEKPARTRPGTNGPAAARTSASRPFAADSSQDAGEPSGVGGQR